MPMEKSPRKNIAPCAQPAKADREPKVDREVKAAVMDKPRCVRPVAVRDVPEAKVKCAPPVADKEPPASQCNRCLRIPQPISDQHFPAGSSGLESLLPCRATSDR